MSTGSSSPGDQPNELPAASSSNAQLWSDGVEMEDRRKGELYSNDCYSGGERRWMERGQRLRSVVLQPLLVLLGRLGINADSITVVALLIGLAFVPLWLLGWKLAALTCVCAQVLLDGLDGAVARQQQTCSPRGSFTDTFADQFVISGVTLAWMLDRPTPWIIAMGTTYVLVYATVVGLAMVRNALRVPYTWLIRPRFLIYACLAADFAIGSTCTLVVMSICNVILLGKLLSGFLSVRRALPGPKGVRPPTEIEASSRSANSR